MRNRTTDAAMLLIPAMLLGAGCSEQPPALPEDTGPGMMAEDTPDPTPDPGIDFAAEQAAAEAEARAAIADYQRDMQAGIEELNAQIDGLRERASEMAGVARAEMDTTIVELEVQRDAFIHRLERVAEYAAVAWDDVRRGLDEAWDDLARSVRAAEERLDD